MDDFWRLFGVLGGSDLEIRVRLVSVSHRRPRQRLLDVDMEEEEAFKIDSHLRAQLRRNKEP